MRLLLDTHFLLWSVVDPDLIRSYEHKAMADSEVLISPISIWELRLKWQRRDKAGVRKGVLAPERALAYIADAQMSLVSLSGTDCATSLELALDHRDPFDEMLLIHAARLDARLLTRDRHLVDHPIAYRRPRT